MHIYYNNELSGAFKMKTTESSLRKVIRKVIKEAANFENEEGDIHPDWMEMFEWYQWDIIFVLEYWEGWNGLDYKFIEGQCKQSFPRDDVPRDVGFELKHNPDLFERALHELVGSGRVNAFWGDWHPKNDLDHDHSKPDWETPKEIRRLYAIPKGHKYQNDFVPYSRRRK
jgi:hypothetical protein